MATFRRTFILPALFAGLVLVSACGSSTSSGSKSSDTTTMKSTTTAMPATTSGGTVKLSGSFCDMVVQVTNPSYMSTLFAGTQSTNPADQLAAYKKGFATFADTFHKLATAAPAAVKADLDYVVKAVDQVNAQIQSMTTFSDTALTNDTKALNSAEFQAHIDNLKSYSEKSCGVSSSS